MDVMNEGTPQQGVETLSTGIGSSDGSQPQPQPQSQAGAAIPQGAVIGDAPGGGSPAGAAIPQGATIGDNPDADIPEGLNVKGDDNPFMKGIKEVNAVGAGLGEGLLGTVNGAADILHLPHQLLKDRQDQLAHQNSQNTAARAIGYGGETLLEIIMGDEALKAVPLTKKLLYASQTMETLEKSPKLLSLLKAGAAQEAIKAAILQGGQTLIKSGGDIGQAAEDAAMGGVVGGGMRVAGNALGLGAKSAKTILGMNDAAEAAPSENGVFSKLADHINDVKSKVKGIYDSAIGGAEADRAAATKEADATFAQQKDNAEEMLRNKKEHDSARFTDRNDKVTKGRQVARKYAQTTLVDGMDKLAGDGALEPEELAKKVNEGIDKYEEGSHTAYEEGINGENGIVTRLKGTSLPVKESPISAAAAKLIDTPDPDEHEAVIEAMAGAGDKLDPRVKTLLENLRDGTKKFQTTGADGKPVTIEKPMKDWTADRLIKFRQSVRKWSAVAFQRGDINRNVLGDLINSVDDTLEKLAGQAGEHTGTPFSPGEITKKLEADPKYAYHATNVDRAHEIAGDHLNTHEPWDFTDQESWPDGSSEKRNYFSANPSTTAAFAPEEGQPVLLRTPRTADFKTEGGTGDLYSTAPIPSSKLEALGADGNWHPVDSSFGDHAQTDDVLGDYQKLRGTYKQQRALLDSNVADKLKLNEPDKAFDSVNKYLTSGGNPLAKIDTIRKVIGDESMSELGRSQVAGWKKLAEDDPKKFLTQFKGMSEPVRDSLLGPEMSSKLQQLADIYEHTTSFADEHAKTLLKEIGSDAKQSKATTQQLFGNTGPGTKQLGGLVGEGYKLANASKLSDIASKYSEAVDAATKAFEDEPVNVSSSFLKNLSEGRVNEALLKGQVDPVDIRRMKAAIPDKWDGIADGIFQRAIADAAPDGKFNPDKLIEWWKNIPEDTRTELFNLNDPANAAKMQKVMDEVNLSAEGRRMVRWAAGVPIVAGAGGAGAAVGSLAGVMGPHFLGTLGEILGMMTSVGSSKELIRSAIEKVADSPGTWRTLLKANAIADKVGGTQIGKAAAAAAPHAAPTLRKVYAGLQGSLSR